MCINVLNLIIKLKYWYERIRVCILDKKPDVIQ